MKTEIQQQNLPAEWSAVELGELLERITNGLTCVQEKEPPGIPVTRIETISNGVVDFERVRYVRDLDEAKKARFILQHGDILFSHINSDLHLGKTAVVTTDKPLLHGMNLLLLRTKKELLDPYYLHYLLNYHRRSGAFMAIAQHAVNQSSLNQKKINSLKVPLAPLDQQKRIVAEIEKQFSRLDEAVANLKRVKANLKRYKAAVLKAAVEGRLVETEAERARRESRSYETGAQLLQRILKTRRSQWVGKGKYKEPAAPDITDLSELPEGWGWTNFDQVTERVTKGSSPNWQGFEYCDKGIPFVRSQNVGWGVTELSNIAFLPPAFNEVEKKSVLQEGDVLLNIVGASIGRSAIAPSAVEGGNVNQAVAVIRLLESGISNQFVLLYLLSAQTQRRIHAEKVDVARANFSLEDIRVMPLALPPYVEQQRIVSEVDRHLSVLGKTEVQVDANLQRAERLRSAVLSNAFSNGI